MVPYFQMSCMRGLQDLAHPHLTTLGSPHTQVPKYMQYLHAVLTYLDPAETPQTRNQFA